MLTLLALATDLVAAIDRGHPIRTLSIAHPDLLHRVGLQLRQHFSFTASLNHRERERDEYVAAASHADSNGIRRVEGPKPKINITCPDCTLVIEWLMLAGTNATYMNVTKALLGDVCDIAIHKEKDQKICREVAQWLEKELPKIVKDLQKGEYAPDVVCAVLLGLCKLPCCQTRHTPEQLHLSFGSSNVFHDVQETTSMTVTWVTLDRVDRAAVRWSANSSRGGVEGRVSASRLEVTKEAPVFSIRTYTAGGWIGTIYSATMSDLVPNTTYAYQVGSDDTTWSRTFHFTTVPFHVGQGGNHRPFRIATIADMDFGPASTDTVQALTSLVEQGQLDAVIHYGDISYADGDQPHWDDFWRKVEPIAARVPYMTTPGNHELFANFSAYYHRVASPAIPNASAFGVPANAMYYSLTVGPATMLLLNTETDIDTPDLDDTQMKWADSVMEAANRTERPWLLVFHHRPLYCTSHPKDQCEIFADVLKLQAEAKYIKHKVDLVTCGHQHNYERSWPLEGGLPTAFDYTNAPSPVYIVNGAAGNREGQFYVSGKALWSAAHSMDVGFGILLMNGDVMTSTFYRSNDSAVVDQIVFTKS